MASQNARQSNRGGRYDLWPPLEARTATESGTQLQLVLSRQPVAGLLVGGPVGAVGAVRISTGGKTAMAGIIQRFGKARSEGPNTLGEANGQHALGK